MGLAERRALEEFRTDSYEKWRGKIVEAAGYDVPVDVEWDTLGKEGLAQLYDKIIPQVYFTPIIGALQSITKDELGKEALRAALKKIVIRHSERDVGTQGFSFEKGVLTNELELQSYEKSYTDERQRTLKALLESKL